jgi:hypothetical protein
MPQNKTPVLTCLTLFLTLAAILPGQSEIITETNFSSVVGAGARALGMGGAFIAIADDATAASWNPAGLAQLERFSLSVVGRFDNTRRLTPARGDAESRFFMGPEMPRSSSLALDFASMTLPIRLGKIKLVPQISYQRAIGFNLNSNQGGIPALMPEVDPLSRERYYFQGNFYNNDEFSGGFDMVTASLGTRLFRWLNVGYSLNYWFNGYEGKQLKGSIGVFYTESRPDLRINADHEVMVGRSFDIRGLSHNIGLLIELRENLKIGAVYKTAFTADIDYWNRTQVIDFKDGRDKQNVHEASGRSKLTWPRSFGLGLSYRPADPLTLSIDYTNTEWSEGMLRNYQFDNRIQNVYFPTLRPLEDGFETPQMDAEQIRLGLEYVIFGQKVLIPLRAGFFTDSQYYSDATGRTVSMVGFTGGVGVNLRKVSFDLAVIYETGSYLGARNSYGLSTYSELRIYASTIFNL